MSRTYTVSEANRNKIRKGARRGGKKGSREDKSRAGKIGFQKMIEKVAQQIHVAPSPEPAPEPVKVILLPVATPSPILTVTTILTVIIEDRQVEVPRKTYVAAKTKQLREFGYGTLTENTVSEQLDAILAGKPTSVIGGFMKDEIVLPVKPS